MEERLFEKFLELIEKRDEEIGHILGYSKFEHLYRIGRLPRLGGDLPKGENEDETKELLRKRYANKILNGLQRRKRAGASKSDFENHLNRLYPECDIIELTVYLFKCVKPSTSQACSYTIKVMYDGYVIPTAYSGGYFDVCLVSPDGQTKTINFRYGRDKVLYTWFLLHPRLFMTKETIWCPDDPTRTAFNNQHLMEMSKMMYPEEEYNPLINYIEKRSWKNKDASGDKRTLIDFKKNFSMIKRNINAYVRKAWMELGGEGDDFWYTVQEEFETPDHIAIRKTVSSRYLINLDGDNISFINKNQPDSTDAIPSNRKLTSCRMEEGKYQEL